MASMSERPVAARTVRFQDLVRDAIALLTGSPPEVRNRLKFFLLSPIYDGFYRVVPMDPHHEIERRLRRGRIACSTSAPARRSCRRSCRRSRAFCGRPRSVGRDAGDGTGQARSCEPHECTAGSGRRRAASVPRPELRRSHGLIRAARAADRRARTCRTRGGTSASAWRRTHRRRSRPAATARLADGRLLAPR